ncbi:MAG: hypothetical protein ACFB0B_06225 [Thermonemataceae bacterium]
MNDKENKITLQIRKINTARRYLRYNAFLYGLYAFYMLTEVLDLAQLLFVRPENATYDLVYVIFHMAEFITCTALAFVFVIAALQMSDTKYVILLCVIVLLFRIGIVYYFYFYQEPLHQRTPFIYKQPTEISRSVRRLFITLQLIGNVLVIFLWGRIAYIIHN